MFIIKTGPTIRKTEIGNVFIKMSKINIFFSTRVALGTDISLGA